MHCESVNSFPKSVKNSDFNSNMLILMNIDTISLVPYRLEILVTNFKTFNDFIHKLRLLLIYANDYVIMNYIQYGKERPFEAFAFS